MSERRGYLDRGFGETRAVVTLNGRPERMLFARVGETSGPRPGARYVARVRKVEPAFASAFLDLGADGEGLLGFKPEHRPIQGQALEVEIKAAARQDKLATLRVIGPAEGEPRRLADAPDIVDQLSAYVDGEALSEGRTARDMADEAQAEILQTVHPLPGGGSLAIEPTRALVAVDVDLGNRGGQDAKRITRQANMVALTETARLLRLKSLGGLVVIDLVGRGHDGTALLNAARTAFAPDNPGVAIGPVGRFGTMEITVPRRDRPSRELLMDARGQISDLTLALDLIRRLESEARSQPGARLLVRCSQGVASAAGPAAERLAAQIGHRFEIIAEPGRDREQGQISIR